MDSRNDDHRDSAMLLPMPRALTPDPPGLGIAVSLNEALGAGMTRPQVRHRVETRRWEQIGRGRYLRHDALNRIADQWDRRDLRHAAVAASAASSLPGAVVALSSAALVHGLPLLTHPARVDLIAAPGAWTGVRGDVHLHGLGLNNHEFMPVPTRDGPPLVADTGVRVTTPARTWVDIARTRSLADALAAGDAALRRHLCRREQLALAASNVSGLRGCRSVVRALNLLSALRESPFESVSFAEFVGWGIPLPEMQVAIHDDDGFVGRVDFLWRNSRVIGEADGAMK